jgi:hypothetical protein
MRFLAETGLRNGVTERAACEHNAGGTGPSGLGALLACFRFIPQSS